jgi:hypothetical protein
MREEIMKGSNLFDTREAWLRAAASELRQHFKSCGYELAENIRYAIAFPSTGRKGKRVGECWHCSSSADSSYEIFIRADLSDPEQVLAVQTKELVHTLLPTDAGHGKLFKTAATRIGLEGPMREAKPGPLLKDRLAVIAVGLGPLPHARLNLEQLPMTTRGTVIVDAPKKQATRYRKAECMDKDCGFTVRVTASHVRNIGPPHCPRHGAMVVDMPVEEMDGEDVSDDFAGEEGDAFAAA